MQSQNIFTVGGSLSVNVHGRDIRHEALIDTVDSFRLLMADGTVRNVSRERKCRVISICHWGLRFIWSYFRCDAEVNR